jgi:phage-related baseplate assembly protein
VIDLSQLPPPDVVEPLDFETLLATRKARLISLYPADQQATVAAELSLESDPRTKLLEESAYDELLLRQRINDAARALLLAYAARADLDELAASFDVQRLVIDPGDPTAQPPVPPTYESDEALRTRVQLSPESYTSCGTFGAYEFHALSVPGVRHAQVIRPEPGVVRIVILATEGDGTAPAALLDAVRERLTARDLRSVNDTVEVVSAEIVGYRVAASLVLYPGPAGAPVLEQARAAMLAYAEQTHRLGYDVTLSGLYAALHRPGVQRVVLAEPLADILCDASQAPYLLDLQLALSEASDV